MSHEHHTTNGNELLYFPLLFTTIGSVIFRVRISNFCMLLAMENGLYL